METFRPVLTEEFTQFEVFLLIREAGGGGAVHSLVVCVLTFFTESLSQTSKYLDIRVFGRAGFCALTTVSLNCSVKAKDT